MRSLLLCSMLVLSGPLVQAEERTLELADGAAPISLTVRVAYSTIEVTGTNRTDVLLSVEPIDDLSAPDLPIHVNGNRIEIIDPANDLPVRLVIETPRRGDLVLESSNLGLIEVSDFTGSVEIINSNGPVRAERISGSLSVFTSNGGIRASMRRVDGPDVVSLVTSNGSVRLELPARFEGRVLAQTDGPPIACEFELVPETPGARRRFGRIVEGRVGDGESFVRLRTVNAGIEILRGSTVER